MATGLDFRGNVNGTASASPSARMVFNGGVAGSTAPFAAYPATYIWRAFPRAQTLDTSLFWTMLFHANYTTVFTGTEEYYGMHPYPDVIGNNRTEWEISADGGDVSIDPVTFARWTTCVSIVSKDGSNTHHAFYWNWPTLTDVVTFNGVLKSAATNPCIVIGDAPWNIGFEIPNAVLRGFQYYDTNLTNAQIQYEIDNPGSFRTPWYINLNPTPSDIADKSGAGHNPAWADAGRPALWNGLEYVGGAEASGGANAAFNVSLTALTGGLATAAAQGDLVIVGYGCVSTADRALAITSTGYTEEAELYANDTRDANVAAAWKLMASPSDTSIQVAAMGGLSTEGAVAVAHVWRGADATPMDVTRSFATAINASPPDSPTITPVTNGAIVVAVGLGTSAAVDSAVSAPAGYTNQVDISVDPGAAATIGIASKVWAGSGAEDPAAWTNWTTSNSDSWGALTFAIQPATPLSSDDVLVRMGSLTAVDGSGLVTPTFTTGAPPAGVAGGSYYYLRRLNDWTTNLEDV